ncbi:CueP family metal-binding protein [Virgibacillus sp. MG-45]|uniref:CueP family metal-binding protein n=1 Tax=Virgibacillus sp. MG-45 TaxID=3102791 RepID=UPI002ED8A11C
MKLKISAVIMLLVAAFLVACNDDGTNEESASKKETTDIKQLVQDYSVGEITDQSASITSQELIVTDADNSETIYDLPKDEFFVSIAPFIEQTHPCTNHSLTGCQGEMVEKDFDVLIEDTDGNVIVDKTVTSQKNGFFDLWLPRDKTYRVVITHDGKQVESEISTFENDGTCITTMQLT